MVVELTLIYGLLRVNPDGWVQPPVVHASKAVCERAVEGLYGVWCVPLDGSAVPWIPGGHISN